MSARKWIKTNYPGVRYREHADRKFSGALDRYFSIRYNKIEESVGWRSEGMNAQKASALRAMFQQNIKSGVRPQSLREKREMEQLVVEAEKKQQKILESKDISLDEAAWYFLCWKIDNRKDPKNDQSRYKNHIGPIIGHLKMSEITPFDIEKMKSKLFQKKKGTIKKWDKSGTKVKRLSPKTVKHCLVLIGSIYRKAIQWKLYDGDIPTVGVDVPAVDNRRTRFLSYEESHLLLDELQKMSPVVFEQATIALHCGLRFKEVANLRWMHINLDNNVMNILDSKGVDTGQVYITGPVRKILIDLKKKFPCQNHHLLYPNKHGQPQTEVSNTFQRCVTKLGLNDGIEDDRHKVVFHSLRHTFASWLAIEGIDIYRIKELMRHKDIKMTERYAHLIPSAKQEAVAVIAEKFEKLSSDATVIDINSQRAR